MTRCGRALYKINYLTEPALRYCISVLCLCIYVYAHTGIVWYLVHAYYTAGNTPAVVVGRLMEGVFGRDRAAVQNVIFLDVTPPPPPPRSGTSYRGEYIL
jgi:hypothetical protein